MTTPSRTPIPLAVSPIASPTFHLILDPRFGLVWFGFSYRIRALLASHACDPVRSVGRARRWGRHSRGDEHSGLEITLVLAIIELLLLVFVA